MKTTIKNNSLVGEVKSVTFHKNGNGEGFWRVAFMGRAYRTDPFAHNLLAVVTTNDDGAIGEATVKEAFVFSPTDPSSMWDGGCFEEALITIINNLHKTISA